MGSLQNRLKFFKNSKLILSHTKTYKSFDALGWKIREKIYIWEKNNNFFNKNPWKNKKSSQNLSKKQKTALRNLIKTKNDKLIINDTRQKYG